jgi:hypothetical protein
VTTRIFRHLVKGILFQIVCLGAFALTERGIFLGSGNLIAQELELFEEIEVSEGLNTRNRGRGTDNGNEDYGPEFTLTGTTRIGPRYSVFLRDQKGAIIVVNSTSKADVFIPGHPSYRLVKVGTTDVSVRYPEGRPCIESLGRGIKCSAENIALLTLTNRDPLESKLNTTVEISNPDGIRGLGNGSQEDAPVNPFAALLEQSADANSSNTDGFVPRRIRAEDVPQGMRVVSTPFGDRLVEE